MYSHGQSWLRPPGSGRSGETGIPDDAFWLEGHDGQSMVIVPSASLVMVRLGLTPSWLRYRPEILLKEILAKLPPPTRSASADLAQ
jgi:CubicO group peptidase (beta-lactamase class C family)